MQVKKQQSELDMEQQTGSKSGKECVKAVYCHPAHFNLYAEYIMQNAELDEAQTVIKIVKRNINNLTYADDTTLTAESKELNSLLMKVKEESEKVGLRGIWSHHFMANRWGNSSNSERLSFLGFQNHCRW